jgi:N-acetylmuramoyl-L-alanine amidase
MIVMSGSNTHESRLQRSKRANDLDADLFISIHHGGVKNETRMPWRYNGGGEDSLNASARASAPRTFGDGSSSTVTSALSTAARSSGERSEFW